ncbi:uncharacterized protein LOC141714709 [Apium graveolens]|uniref:uncharacterized protein LOC141714709 n=1 Tax=Apium graveolens TaxID=4045 RepID=UPI003D7B5743
MDEFDDEIQSYFDGSYICGCEAAYRVFGFNIHYMSLVVELLSFHLEGRKPCTFRANEPLPKVITREREKHNQLEAYSTLNATDKIHNILKSIGKSLEDYSQMPQPPHNYLDCGLNNLIVEETSHNIAEMDKEFLDLYSRCNDEQLEIYNAFMHSVENRERGGMLFIYGSGGCGKTFLWRKIISKLRSRCDTVLPVASSVIAATLMPGGRMTHSRFKIPIVLDEHSMCSISHTSDIVELIKQTKLIIWDKAPMQHRYYFECVDQSLRDIMKAVDPGCFHMPFGGDYSCPWYGGDFHHILPVITRASRGEIISLCITRSKLWKIAEVFKMRHNMRLSGGNSLGEVQDLRDFAEWVLDIGDGNIGTPN